jgi:carboxymethylenebutenolidase
MCNPATNYWPGKQNRPGDDVQVQGKDGHSFTVHVSRPEGEPPYPTMLILSDYFDPENYYYDLAEQYAAAGYLGVCPDLYEREGNLPEQTHEAASARHVQVSDDHMLEDVDATLEWLRAEGLLGELAVTGFCLGGRLAYLVAARHPEIKLLTVFYGYFGTGPGKDQPYSPLDEAGRIKARSIGSYGGGDDSIPLDQIAAMEGRLKANGVEAELKVYPGAPHCFFRTPEWAEASDDAWGRVLGALKETVG